MARPERIILVQLSDIHVGSLRNQFYSNTSVRAGLHGHDPVLLPVLRNAFADIKNRMGMSATEPLNVVVSGDLSCAGLRTDFSQAYTYLLSELFTDPPLTGAVGLHVPTTQLWTIPGNHDHWNGHHHWPFQPAYDPTLFPAWFDTTPWRSAPLVSPKKTLRLELFGVDSNSGLSGQSYSPRAEGCSR